MKAALLTAGEQQRWDTV